MHPARERIAAVIGRRTQGSGYLLAPRLVLTAAHVARDSLQVAVPGGAGPVACRALWTRDDDKGDVALLLAERDLVPPQVAAAFEPVVWGRVGDLRVWRDAQTIGFPQAARDAHDELDTEQLVGTLKPGSQLLGGRHVLDSDHGAPAALADGGSPWAGMSGAAVFVGGLLCGVVCEDPGGWRHGRLAVTPMFRIWSDPEFLDLCAEHGHKPVSRALASSLEVEEETFERRLRDYLVERAGELTIVGLTLSDTEGEVWPLDAAYLSLELTGGEWPVSPGRNGHWATDIEPATELHIAAASPRRAEAALAGQHRVLLRGAAGSGKTTLLQWLTTIAAKEELPPGLDHFRGCVPLPLPLRTLVRHGSLPEPEEFLRTAARPLAGQPAARGWVTRRLAEGSVLLLIDGVDEVPEADRRRTLAWIKELLAAYPDARYVITTRPSAVREGWLADAGFTELELLPMSRADVAAFIDRWHTAAGQHESEQLRTFRAALAKAVVAKPDLGRLATNPLMCALICALNRSRRGNLPHGRMELYRAALELLLVRRDREREIPGPDLDQAQQVALLQKIAYWLIRNGRSEIEWHKAVDIVARALPRMPLVAARGDAGSILRHIVLRSGLLRRPTAETLDFIHRTFQDYLGSQAAVDEWDFGVLVAHAHDDQWEDVLRMAVGHASPRERTELLGKLMDRAAQEEPYRRRLRLLALACLEHATELDPAVRQLVEISAAGLVPPRDVVSAKALAASGTIILDLLPGPDSEMLRKFGNESDEVARAVVVAATTVADERAIPLLAAYADHSYLGVRAQLAWAWDRFDTEHYADEVVAKLAYAGEGMGDLEFVVQSKGQLSALKRLGGRPWVRCVGALTSDDLVDLGTPVLNTLSFRSNPGVVDLRALDSCPPLLVLGIAESGGWSNLHTVNSEALHTLNLAVSDGPGDLGAVSDMTSLEVLALDWALGVWRPRELSLPSKLQYLRLGLGPSSDLRLGDVSHCRELKSLSYRGADEAPENLALRSFPSLTELRIDKEDLRAWEGVEPLPRVERLFLDDPLDLAGLVRLPAAFPHLKELWLYSSSVSKPLDAAHLAGLESCSISIEHHGPILNRELLPIRARLTGPT
ncbi:NACHT domain-containing protein [Streptomyces olivoreticuli]|uniref:serine protease n=1 Tax=Streptomyces olivoreticuli TaxID=68246 RepID=UPI0026595139|nr:serine protease [Streptomyces olivoreticuli]WKK21222.1 NACHT domain-containing protein [Streptomyces olivoreticuli]